MPGDDQERFEDYLELERFIAALQAGQTAHPPQELTPAQARVYRLAMLFHAATPGMSEPDAEYAAQLRARLEIELQMLQRNPPPVEMQATRPMQAVTKQKKRLPRRLLLAGGASAAAALAVGAGVEHMAEMAVQNPPGPEVTVRISSPMDWFYVTTVAEMGNQAVKFRTEDQSGALSLTGYVVRNNGSTSSDPVNSDPMNSTPIEKGDVIAVSAACTHKGCIVEWFSSDRKFHCPCHGGVFGEDGGIDATMSSLYLKRLALLDVKVQSNGEIYVRMPTGD